MFKNLEAEMIRSSVSSENIAEVIGKSYNTTRAKIVGTRPFTIDEAMAIKKTLFPNNSIDYLFATESEV